MLVNFIRSIYSQSDTICSFVESFLTTYSIESSDFRNYEIHSIDENKKEKRRRKVKVGKVYLVGAGPGDIDLITVKGLNCIKKSDVILYDRLVNEELLNYAKKGAKLIYCGKRPGYHAMIQERINRL